ncbi:CHAD domain-containing protein [Halomonas cerina]|uniref:Phosphohistidine phosphatase n=1 Tax=Halomonas cerina TaxID=447424 RepID=A0A839VCN7_9GAMM|nr:CHAD domain-containing protein [Halomonas cerina]MBB3190276.1 phosphohistidine phosphatase [Halomonas cerina]
MLDLYLMRHAKAKHDGGDMADRHRPLSKRGRRQVAAMARPLQRLGALAGEIHVSPATRTRQTLLGLDENLAAYSLAKRAHTREALYTFDRTALLEWLMTHPAETGSVLLIGHNPALRDLARWLCQQAPPSLPTAGLLHLSLPDGHWQDRGRHQAELVTRLVPTEASHAFFKRRAPKAPDLKKASLAKRALGLLTHQYHLVRALEPGVIAGVDPEFLHQYRVNLRRSRAIGESVRATSDTPGLKKALKRLKRRAQATSDLRDLDVFLDHLDHTPPSLSDTTLSAVCDWLSAQAREQHSVLCQELAQPAYARDMKKWQDFLATKRFRKALRALSSDEIEAVLAQRISQHDHDLRALTSMAPDETLHTLRKTVKRIRYLAELDPVRNKAFLAGLKQRQTLLGDFQDLCTRQAWIKAFANAGTASAGEETIQLECRAWIETIERHKKELRQRIVALEPLTGSLPSN